MNFIDAQQMKKDHPKTFDAPSQNELDALYVGDFVKVAIEGERFWVLLTIVNGDKLTGNVDNDLVKTDKHNLSNGDTISFEKRNVYSVDTSSNEVFIWN